jgi:hypothetical protein
MEVKYLPAAIQLLLDLMLDLGRTHGAPAQRTNRAAAVACPQQPGRDARQFEPMHALARHRSQLHLDRTGLHKSLLRRGGKSHPASAPSGLPRHAARTDVVRADARVTFK